MKLALDRPKLVSLAAGFTDNESLPVDETRALIDEVLKNRPTGQAALQYGSTIGDLNLRRLTADRLHSSDGLKATRGTPERTIITSGSQQLLYLTTEALCDPGDVVIVEDPTYFVYLGIAQSHALRCRAVRMEEDGIDLDDLERVLDELKACGDLPRLKLVYLVTYFQNPTGRTTAWEKKVRCLELLRRYERFARHPIYLLEDAAYRELRFSGPDEPSALTAQPADRVIYAGTYSKPFATGVRVGFGVLPEPVFTAVARLKGNHDFGTSNLLQQLLARALESGAYARHVTALRERYASKATLMVTAIREQFSPSVAWAEPRGGLYVWAKLPARVSTGPNSKLFKAALNTHVLYVPGQLCYGEDPSRRKPNHEMRLSFGGAIDRDIPRGIELLGRALKQWADLKSGPRP